MIHYGEELSIGFKDKIRVIEDFPQKGISFKDITTLLKDRDAFKGHRSDERPCGKIKC